MEEAEEREAVDKSEEDHNPHEVRMQFLPDSNVQVLYDGICPEFHILYGTLQTRSEHDDTKAIHSLGGCQVFSSRLC